MTNLKPATTLPTLCRLIHTRPDLAAPAPGFWAGPALPVVLVHSLLWGI